MKNLKRMKKNRMKYFNRKARNENTFKLSEIQFQLKLFN